MENTKIELYQVVQVILYRLKTGCQWRQLPWFVVERTNAWLDALKAILVRFETNTVHWKALNILAFCVILLRQL